MVERSEAVKVLLLLPLTFVQYLFLFSDYNIGVLLEIKGKLSSFINHKS